jgi:hypothetical protein
MASVTYPLEFRGVPIFKITIAVKVDQKTAHLLDALGFGEAELNNKLTAIMQDVTNALDGSVDGLIVSNMEPT